MVTTSFCQLQRKYCTDRQSSQNCFTYLFSWALVEGGKGGKGEGGQVMGQLCDAWQLTHCLFATGSTARLIVSLEMPRIWCGIGYVLYTCTHVYAAGFRVCVHSDWQTDLFTHTKTSAGQYRLGLSWRFTYKLTQPGQYAASCRSNRQLQSSIGISDLQSNFHRCEFCFTFFFILRFLINIFTRLNHPYINLTYHI